MSIYLGTTPLTGTAGQRNIGQIIQSTIPLSDAGLHLLDGSVISGSGSYSAFVTHIARLVSGHSELFTTEANWQTSVTNYGVCGKFVYDSVNNTVRLPKITGFTEGTIDVTALGDLIQAGLPNITGAWKSEYNINMADGTQCEGALYAPYSTSPGLYGGSGAGSGWGYGIKLDASYSDSIYGNSTTVQPQAIKVLYYIVIATSTKTNIQVDIDEVMTDLNSKVDIADLAECSVVVSRTANSLGGITEIWSDGYCVQTGQLVRTATGILNVTLDKEYINNNYIVIATNRAADTYTSASTYYPPYVLNVTTTGFSMSSNAAIANINRFTWRAEGYIR